MAKLSILVAVAAIFYLVSGAYISGDISGDKVIRFSKTTDGSKEFDFQYNLENGDIYTGQTYHVSGRLYMIFGANNIVYSVEINKEEIKNKNDFTKLAHVVERKGNKFSMKGNLNKYVLDVAENHLSVTPYATQWDLENICFSRLNPVDLVFNYTIVSKNNARKYTGITYSDEDDPMVQRIRLKDGNQHDGVYEIQFTEYELTCDQDFCRGITKTISAHGVLGSSATANINPNLFKALAGRLYQL